MRFRDAVCTGLAVLGAASFLMRGSALSQDAGGEPAGGTKIPNSADPRDNDLAEGMRRWQETMKAGPQHKGLEKFLGTWETATRFQMGGNWSAADKGTAEFTWLFPGGKWLQQKTRGTMMGMPMEGFGVHGYDNYKRKYVGLWINSLGTNMLTFEGNYDRTRKTMLEFGTMDEPMTGEHDKMVRYVTREISADEFVLEVHDLPIGEEGAKVVEVRYTRKP